MTLQNIQSKLFFSNFEQMQRLWNYCVHAEKCFLQLVICLKFIIYLLSLATVYLRKIDPIYPLRIQSYQLPDQP